jgi:phosphate starvation-inducible PhoH-like protein
MQKPKQGANRKKSVQDVYESIEDMSRWHHQEALKNMNFKINCKFKNKKQKQMYDTIMANRITFVSGPAGTGKTLVALMAGLECVKDKTINLDQIILTKPIVEITSSRSIGALPGDLNEKTLSYFTHFYDNLTKLIGTAPTGHLKENGIIKETILNFLRGSTFGKYNEDGKPVGSFCIFDESQNCTVTEMKTFISRMGEESKLVILGDIDQIDLKMSKGELCGLDDAIQRLGGISGIAHVEFTEDDIVRDPFLVEIMKRYKKS